MHNTYLVGYYGMKNTGDDALLAATAWGAKRFFGSSSFVVNTPRKLSIADIGNAKPTVREIQPFPAYNRCRQYAAAIASSQVIFGGGSVFQNQRDIDLKRDLIMLSRGRRHIALGVGIGPFETTAAEKSCARFLNQCAFTGVRDQQSYEIATLIAPRANIEKTFDLAPSLLSCAGISQNPTERRGIAVSLCPHESLKGNPQAETQRNKAIAKALRLLYQETGEPVCFIDFNGHRRWGDHAIHQEVAQLMSGIPFSIIPYNPNPLATLNLLSGFKFIISMRLHGSIFGFIANTPVISLNYHAKCDGWCDQIGMPEEQRFALPDITGTSLARACLQGLERGFSAPKMSISTANHLAMNNWSYSDAYLAGRDICTNPSI